METGTSINYSVFTLVIHSTPRPSQMRTQVDAYGCTADTPMNLPSHFSLQLSFHTLIYSHIYPFAFLNLSKHSHIHEFIYHPSNLSQFAYLSIFNLSSIHPSNHLHIMYVSIYSPTHPSNHQSSHTFMHLSICQSPIYWCIYPSIHLSILSSIYKPIHQLIHLLTYTYIHSPNSIHSILASFHPSICMIMPVSTHLSFYLLTTHTFLYLFIHTFIHPYIPPHPIYAAHIEFMLFSMYQSRHWKISSGRYKPRTGRSIWDSKLP